MKLSIAFRNALLISAGAGAGLLHAQSCPSINFLTAPELVPPTGKIIVIGRQSDGSFSEFVVGPKLEQTIPNIQNSVSSCLPAPTHTGSHSVNFNPSGTASQNGASVDLNGNGIPDLVVALNPPNITIYYDLDITKPASYLTGIQPSGVTVADVNGDGKPDLVVIGATLNTGAGGVYVLLNNGDGTFANGVRYDPGALPNSVSVADINGDGKPDIVVGNSGSGASGSTLAVLLGNGDGTFQKASIFTLPVIAASVVIADFNNDGKPDVAVATLKSVLILLGDGKGGFGTPSTVTSGGDSSALAVGDFNGDGKLDIASGNNQAQTVTILLGKGDGTFQAPTGYAVTYLPDALVVTDFNNDGVADIVIGAGNPNFIGENVNSEVLTFLIGNGDGTFEAAPSYPVSGTGAASFIATGDFNGDGKPDALIGGRSASGLSLFAGNGDGTFKTPSSIALTGLNGLAPGATTVAVGDFNGDGRPDVAYAETQAAGFGVLLNAGGGAFQTPSSFSSGGATPTGIVTADFNGDGKADLAIINGASQIGSASPLAPNLVVFNGGGNGAFNLANTYPTVGLNPVNLAAGDLNGDGKADLVVSDGGQFATFNGAGAIPGAVYVFRNQGDGTFAAPAKYTAAAFPREIVIGDVNGDGKPDLVVATSDANVAYQISVFLGNGNGTFQSPVSMSTDFGPQDMVIRDFNGDGKADIVIAHCCGDTDMTYMLGHGDGTFDPEIHFVGGASPTALSIVDLNGDGKPDLLVAGAVNPGTLTPLLNLSTAASTATVAVVSNASFAKGAPVTAESIASAFGAHLATQTVVASLPLMTSLGGTTVDVLDSAGTHRPALIFDVTNGQVDFEVPLGTANGTATVTIRSGDGVTSSGTVQIANVAPGFYTVNSASLAAGVVLSVAPGGAQTATLTYQVDPTSHAVVPLPINLDPQANSTYLELYGTGFRHAQASDVTITAGGATVPNVGLAAQSMYAGLDQLNVFLPYSLKGSGDIAITVTIAGQTANTVHVTIK